MASNTQSVSGDVLFQTDDDLSETNITKSAAQSNLTDYVERGMGFSVDYAANEVTIGSGHVIIQDGAAAYDIFPNQKTLSLANSSAVNYVFVVHDPNTDDDISYHIDDDDSAPSNPSLKIGTVDTSSNTKDDTINRDPTGSFDSLSTGEIAVNREWQTVPNPTLGDWQENTEGTDIEVSVTMTTDSSPGSSVRFVLDVSPTQSINLVDDWEDTSPSTSRKQVLDAEVPDGHFWRIREVTAGASINSTKVLKPP